MEPFVGTAEVTAFLGRDRNWLYANQDKLGIPRYRLGGGWRYRLSEIERWAEGHRSGITETLSA
ncbi:helix-turn-helix domain-containing protein [Nocardioides sp. BP30]|uniref:helix-turn-helix domain-containing protein n=1 Tax=Nocardioides sp. BP30 TaxID=3036374 RepID=UPI0024697852|nr:helix-turn-helix domain-containing protein [Nocardioides sp. BP30]WGL51599.1 helix-turn-helix domain-containing protein [Nocardioides sp. BP30]